MIDFAYDSQKEQAGTFVTFAWLACSAYFLLLGSGNIGFVMGAAMLVLVLPVAFIYGALMYWAMRAIAKILIRVGVESPGAIRFFGFAVKAGFAVLTFFAVGIAYEGFAGIANR